jgi:hypothetical protein
VKVLLPNPSYVIVEKRYPIGKLQLSYEIKKRLAGDLRIGSGLYPTVRAKECSTFQQQIDSTQTTMNATAFIGRLAVEQEPSTR